MQPKNYQKTFCEKMGVVVRKDILIEVWLNFKLKGTKPAGKEAFVWPRFSVKKGGYYLRIQQSCCYWQTPFPSFPCFVGGNEPRGIGELMNCVLEHMLLISEILTLPDEDDLST